MTEDREFVDIVMAHTCRTDITKLVINNIPFWYRIILVDNSPYHEMNHIRHFRENLLWLKQPFPSSAASALNLGIAEVSTEWALLTPNDILYSIKMFKRIEERFDKLTKGVKMVHSRNGYNGLYHIPTVRELGGFDECLPLRFGENMDFAYRLCKAGYHWRLSELLGGLHIEGGAHTKKRTILTWAPNIPKDKRITIEEKWGWKHVNERKAVINRMRIE